MTLRRLVTSGAVLLFALLAGAGTGQANLIFKVTLDTSPLVGSPAGPFALLFQLNDGSGLGDSNNTATISNFTFGVGGSGGSCPVDCSTAGGASGDIQSTVTLIDSDVSNLFGERFTAGSTLSFRVNLTTNVDAGGTPDAFAFSILDSTTFSIPTLDSSGADSLLTVSIDSDNPPIDAFATDPSRFTNAGGGVSITMDAPGIAAVPPGPPQVPGPGSLLLLVMGTGLVGLLGARRGRQK